MPFTLYFRFWVISYREKLFTLIGDRRYEMSVLILDGLILTLDIIKYKNRYLMLIVMSKNVSEIMTVKIETIGLEDTAQAGCQKNEREERKFISCNGRK